MIAVLDTTGDGWRFVRILHRAGLAVSWVVEPDVEVGFDALPTAFRGVIHRIGFDDRSQLETAVRGCEEVMILNDGETAPVGELVKAALERADPGARVHLVHRDGVAFELSVVTTTGRAPLSPKAKPSTLLVRHVG